MTNFRFFSNNNIWFAFRFIESANPSDLKEAVDFPSNRLEPIRKSLFGMALKLLFFLSGDKLLDYAAKPLLKLLTQWWRWLVSVVYTTKKGFLTQAEQQPSISSSYNFYVKEEFKNTRITIFRLLGKESKVHG